MFLASKNFFAVTFATNKSRSGNSISDIGVQIQHFRPHFDRKKWRSFCGCFLYFCTHQSEIHTLYTNIHCTYIYIYSLLEVFAKNLSSRYYSQTEKSLDSTTTKILFHSAQFFCGSKRMLFEQDMHTKSFQGGVIGNQGGYFYRYKFKLDRIAHWLSSWSSTTAPVARV